MPQDSLTRVGLPCVFGEYELRNRIGGGSGREAFRALHIPTKQIVESIHVCPGIFIHAMDIFQPPGIRMPPDIDSQQ